MKQLSLGLRAEYKVISDILQENIVNTKSRFYLFVCYYLLFVIYIPQENQVNKQILLFIHFICFLLFVIYIPQENIVHAKSYFHLLPFSTS